jgi:hypothetical protein
MKLHLEKFLALTAMIATAQVGTSACTAADDADDTEQNVDEDDDAGAQSGDADDDEGDDDVSDAPDAGEEGGGSDDDVVVEEDAGDGEEPELVDAGPAADDGGLVAVDGGEWVDGGDAVLGDAGDEGVVWADAGGEGVLLGDAGLEGGGVCLGDGSFDPAIEPVECAVFDACLDDPYYYGSAMSQCWEMAWYRRAAVYNDFIGCVNAAELADPCGELADITVSECAYLADSAACPDADDTCTSASTACGEVDLATCETRLAPYPSAERYQVSYCFDAIYATNSEALGPSYEGCGYDFDTCLLELGSGPAAE